MLEGTFYHKCGLLGCLPNAKNPKKDLHACCDTLFFILKGHILAVELGISNPDVEIPSAPLKGGYSVFECRSFIETLAVKVMNRCSIVEGEILNRNVDDTSDSVYNYARVLCHLASLALELTDAWREGDGIRVLRCWRINLLHFFATQRTNFSQEAATRVARSVTTLDNIAHCFDVQCGVNKESSSHTTKSEEEDLRQIGRASCRERV